MNTTVLFNMRSSERTATFALSYAALSLWLSDPFTINATSKLRYFPIRRPTQYPETFTLGRAFLQETYLLVDNERHNFTIYQAAFGGSPQISAADKLPDPLQTQGIIKATPVGSDAKKEHRLSTGAYVGIGVALAAALFLGVGFLWRRHRDVSRPTADQGRFEKAELNGTTKDREEAMGTSRSELQTIEHKQEFSGSQLEMWELDGSKVPIYEMDPTSVKRTDRA